MSWILARKVEMTRVIKNDNFVPVTLLRVPTMKVVGFKTAMKDWYDAIIVGILEENVQEVNLAEGKKTLSKKVFTDIAEFELSSSNTLQVGDDITLDMLDGVVEVEISSISKGKGFAGAMKRHNFVGGPKTHGSKFHRALGSIGTRKPRRTKPGKKMHGHMGCDLVTLKHIPVEIVNKEAKIIGLRGPVPGARNSLVKIRF